MVIKDFASGTKLPNETRVKYLVFTLQRLPLTTVLLNDTFKVGGVEPQEFC